MAEVATVGVIGAGVMGRGVTIALARAGLRVVLVDISAEILDRARADLSTDTRGYAILSPDGSVSADEVLARTAFTTDYADLGHADLIIENATERWAVKKPIYEAIDKICPAGTIFAVNTSAIPITRLAAVTSRPAAVVGMHFMNPAPLKPTVEVIRAYHTSDETIATCRDFLSRIGKASIVVADSAGFVTNRVMMLMINEAIFLLQERAATAADIDRLFIECFGHSMGPLETADLIGLDTVLFSIEVLYQEFRDSKYRPCPLLTQMVDAGLRGCKSGHGFFRYPGREGRGG